MKTKVLGPVLGLGALLSACDPGLTPAWEIKEPGLYGARVDVLEADGGTQEAAESDAGTERASKLSRAMPKFGEAFTIRQYLVQPEALTSSPDQRYDMKLAVCLGFQAPDGSLVCAGGLDLEVPVTAVSDLELLTAPIAIPALDTLVAGLDEEIKRFLPQVNQVGVLGAVCVEGKVERVEGKTLEQDPPSELFRCVGNEGSIYPDALAFTTTVWLDVGKDTPNHNPSFACDSDPAAAASACNQGVAVKLEAPMVSGPFVLVGPEDKKKPNEVPRPVTAWPAYPRAPELLPWENCAADPDLPQVRVGSGEHLIRVRFDPTDRESYDYEKEEYGKLVLKHAREELMISHAMTQYGGELDRQKSILLEDVEDAKAEIDVPYTPPKKNPTDKGAVPEGGRLVRFFFALRDQRGGYDFTTRELCLLPAEKK